MAFAALPALRGLRLGKGNDSRMKEGKSLRRCWRRAGSAKKGVAAQYNRVQHSNPSLWCSPDLHRGWIAIPTPVDEISVDDGLLRSAPLTDEEIEDEFWSWGEDVCHQFVERVDGMTGREAFFAAFASTPPSASGGVSADGRKRMRAK
jgi:hypothetical protein